MFFYIHSYHYCINETKTQQQEEHRSTYFGYLKHHQPLALVVLRIRLHSHPTSKEVGFPVQKSL